LLADLWEGNQNGLAKKVEHYNDKYKFFNYEIEFPEVFTETKTGFDIVIGNPPWDKTKFDDKDFFSQFKTDYRTLSKSEQETIEKFIV
jgi:tRNA1(Val) A37 N6-methylase TrmN6